MFDDGAQQPVRRTMPWRELGRHQPLRQGRLNDVYVEPEVVPIVFVPGIMGSRLMGRTGMVWDPDDVASFCANFALRFSDTPSRMLAMVGSGSYQPHNLWLPHPEARLAPQLSFKNLVQSAYGKVAQALAQQTMASPSMNLCLTMPVYAFAYNWTQSPDALGLGLAHFIKRIIMQHKSLRPCRKVILVTHSMGGIVARSAMMLHGAIEHVVGSVHACMPMAGSPSAYMRMKMGFGLPPSALHERGKSLRAYAQDVLFASLMGATGSGMAQVIGHMPGVLSLLPSHLYRDGAGRPGWVTLRHEHNAAHPPVAAAAAPAMSAVGALPQNCDPYEEIYRLKDASARLYHRPPFCAHERIPCDDERCQHNVAAAIDAVELLHRRLGHRCHPNSHHIVGSGRRTLDSAQWVCAGKNHAVGQDGLATLKAHLALTDVGQGDGDGTVPLSSALCGVNTAADVTHVHGIEHGDAMNAPALLKVVQQRIRLLAHDYISQGLLQGGS